jgi:transcriptional regulator with XRE-family HTH domain
MSKRKSRNSKLASQVGARIRVIRMERGFTVHNLAELAKCSLQCICNLESGISQGTTTTLQKIARALRVQVFDLFNVDTHDDLGWMVESMRHDPQLLQLVRERCEGERLVGA